jgi:hypothetical protein
MVTALGLCSTFFPLENGPILTTALVSKDSLKTIGSWWASFLRISSCSKIASVTAIFFGPSLAYFTREESQFIESLANCFGGWQVL